MNYNEKLMSYLKATCENMQTSYEWWLVHYKTGEGEGTTYSTAISRIDSHLDDMHGAIGFAYFADIINEDQFNDLWNVSNIWAFTYTDKINEMFLKEK